MIRKSFLLSCIGLVLAFGTLGMGSNKATSASPLSLEGLQVYCGLPLACNAATPWQGSVVAVWGRLDPKNIFDQKNYPQLPYEKFSLTDDAGRTVEVWAQGKDNRAVFEKLARRSTDEVVVRGRLAAVKMPIAGGCRTGVKMEIDDAKQISFRSR